METYGELKKAIRAISLKQKGIKVGKLVLDNILGSIPGIANAKTTFEFVKAAFEKPDTKKSNSWLDKLDIDDNMSKIVDDTVENGFLKMIAQVIDAESDATRLEPDFNMNAKMIDYLKNNYSGRTVSGIQENINEKIMKQRFQELAGIKELEMPSPAIPKVKQSSSVTNISKDLEDQTGNFKQINDKNKMISLLDALVGKIKLSNPEFADSSQFKAAVIAFYNKYK
jgi:hypothetical protein